MTDRLVLELLRDLESAAREASAEECEVHDRGPLRGFLHPRSAVAEMSYAMPLRPAADGSELADALSELGRLFAESGRRLRLEFSAALWPDLPAQLERAGLALESCQPLMVCDPHTFRSFDSPDVEVLMLDAGADAAHLGGFLAIRHWSLHDEPGGEGAADHKPLHLDQHEPSADEVRELRNELAQPGRRLALGLVGGEPAGVAIGAPLGGIGELSGVVTLPRFRRRGVAASVSCALVAAHFAAGGTLVWLNADNSSAQSVYYRLGFRDVSSWLNFRAP